MIKECCCYWWLDWPRWQPVQDVPQVLDPDYLATAATATTPSRTCPPPASTVISAHPGDVPTDIVTRIWMVILVMDHLLPCYNIISLYSISSQRQVWQKMEHQQQYDDIIDTKRDHLDPVVILKPEVPVLRVSGPGHALHPVPGHEHGLQGVPGPRPPVEHGR